MQKVEEACWPRPHATSLKKLFLSSPRSPERPSRGTVEFTCTRAATDIHHRHLSDRCEGVASRTTLEVLAWSRYQNLTCRLPAVTK